MICLSCLTKRCTVIALVYILTTTPLSAQTISDKDQSNLGIGLSYSYGLEIYGVSDEEFGLVSTFYGLNEHEVVDFRTVSFVLQKKFNKDFWLGLIFKDGERFFPRESKRNNRLDSGEREYSDYNSIGLSYKTVLLDITKQSDKTKLLINSTGSINYIHLNGFKQLGNPNKNKFQEEDVKSILFEGGLTLTINQYVFQKIWISVTYEPVSLKIGVFGLGAGHTTFGLKVSI
jgi:hypothetical protein